MTRRTVVIRKRSCNWQPNTKRKIQKPIIEPRKLHLHGFINPVFVMLACSAFSGLFYMYSINQSAVKGIEVRQAEKEIAMQQDQNESLKIKEAELKSLYHIEDASKQLNMTDVQNVVYLEENPSVALGKTGKQSNN